MSKRLAQLIVFLLLSNGISASAYASMDGIEWLTRVEQIQASQGLPIKRHVRSQGDVAAVDPGAGTISVFHPEMQSADGSIWMPAMHMVFHVTTRNLLKGLSPGDHIHFTVGRHRGAVMITQINKAP
jgi:Cu/Ag efflux protein CusF